jgi:hypothetical protein
VSQPPRQAVPLADLSVFVVRDIFATVDIKNLAAPNPLLAKP